MNISKLFNKKKPVISFEISPPKKDETPEDIDGTLKLLAHDVDGIHIYRMNQSGSCRQNL